MISEWKFDNKRMIVRKWHLGRGRKKKIFLTGIPKMLLSAWETPSLAILIAARHANYNTNGIEGRFEDRWVSQLNVGHYVSYEWIEGNEERGEEREI
jgi:hypothetical protein